MKFQNRKEHISEILRPRDLPRVTGLSRTSIHRLRVANDFVPVIHLTQHSIGFRRRDIEQWLDARTV